MSSNRKAKKDEEGAMTPLLLVEEASDADETTTATSDNTATSGLATTTPPPPSSLSSSSLSSSLSAPRDAGSRGGDESMTAAAEIEITITPAESSDNDDGDNVVGDDAGQQWATKGNSTDGTSPPSDPKPVPYLWRLYVSHGCTAWTLRMWEFAVALLLIAMRPGSVVLTAVYVLSLALSVMIFNPIMGDAVDRNPRLKAARLSLIFTKLPFALSALFVYLVVAGKVTEETSPFGYWACVVLVIVLTNCGHVAYNGNKLSVERDWVAAIFKGNQKGLSSANSVLRRIDLSCKLVAPMAAGFAMTYGGQSTGALLLCLWNTLSFIPELTLLTKFYNAFPVLATKQQPLQDTHKSKKQLMLKAFTTFASGWKEYRSSSVFLPGVGLALLYATVLSVGPIMSAYCFYRGMSEAVLAVLRAVGALFGLSATFVFPSLRASRGLVTTGMISIWTMVGAMVLCVVAVVVGNADDGNCSSSSTEGEPPAPACRQNMYSELGFLMAGAVTSRFGLWLFDLTVSQLLQEWVDSNVLGIVSGVQGSLQSFCSIVPPLVGIILHKPQNFHILAIMSVCFIVASALVYSAFYGHHLENGSLQDSAHIFEEMEIEKSSSSGSQAAGKKRRTKKKKKRKARKEKGTEGDESRRKLLGDEEPTGQDEDDAMLQFTPEDELLGGK